MNFLILSTLLFFSFSSLAFNPDVFRNNKESISRKVSNQDILKMKNWIKKNALSEEQIYQTSVDFLNHTLKEFAHRKKHCDLYLPPLILNFVLDQRIATTESEVYQYYVYLRYSNLIDDLFYDLLTKSTKISLAFEQNKNRSVGPRPANLYKRYSKVDDVEKFYRPFEKWPDEESSCTIQTYFKHINQLALNNSASRNKDLKKLNWLAVQNGTINLETYNRLEVLRESNLTSWPITLTRYIDIIRNAKDKKAVVIENEATDDFQSNYVMRREKLTRRGKLYASYNSTQIFLMSQIIERTSKRMDAKYVELSIHYTDGEGENYVLSPMEQYRLAINMLKKEIAGLIRSETFRGSPFDYGDLIASAYETGLLKSEDIDQVTKFEDFWNPKIPRWKSYLNYAYSLAGTATYYLPPPWNFLGAVGLIITQMKFEEGPKADPEDNWDSIIN